MLTLTPDDLAIIYHALLARADVYAHVGMTANAERTKALADHFASAQKSGKWMHVTTTTETP